MTKRHGIFIIKNLIRMAILLLAVSAAAFFLISISPVDPLKSNVGQAALGSMSEELIVRLKEYWGVTVPAGERFIRWFPASAGGTSASPFFTGGRFLM